LFASSSLLFIKRQPIAKARQYLLKAWRQFANSFRQFADAFRHFAKHCRQKKAIDKPFRGEAIDVSSLPNAIYILEANTTKGAMRKKLVKE
jgi:hypothetical protein